MKLQALKDRRKGYTTAFGYCSCREDDFDWLIRQVEELEANKTAMDSNYEELIRVFLLAGDLTAAVDCPECDGSGGRHSYHGEPVQCKWCHDNNLITEMTKKLL